VRLSAQTHDRARLQSSVWTRIERIMIERIHVLLRSSGFPRPSHSRLRREILEWLCVIECTESTMIKHKPCDRAHLLFPSSTYFSINRTSCVIF
jgi:hypothetical protein